MQPTHPWLPSCREELPRLCRWVAARAQPSRKRSKRGTSQGALALGAALRPFRRRRAKRAGGQRRHGPLASCGRCVGFETTTSHVDGASLVQTPRCRARRCPHAHERFLEANTPPHSARPRALGTKDIPWAGWLAHRLPHHRLPVHESGAVGPAQRSSPAIATFALFTTQLRGISRRAKNSRLDGSPAGTVGFATVWHNAPDCPDAPPAVRQDALGGGAFRGTTAPTPNQPLPGSPMPTPPGPDSEYRKLRMGGRSVAARGPRARRLTPEILALASEVSALASVTCGCGLVVRMSLGVVPSSFKAIQKPFHNATGRRSLHSGPEAPRTGHKYHNGYVQGIHGFVLAHLIGVLLATQWWSCLALCPVQSFLFSATASKGHKMLPAM